MLTPMDCLIRQTAPPIIEIYSHLQRVSEVSFQVALLGFIICDLISNKIPFPRREFSPSSFERYFLITKVKKRGLFWIILENCQVFWWSKS